MAGGEGKGPSRGYSWPPFAPGNTVSVVHGADSDRQVAPLAEQLVEAFLGHGECPEYLKWPQFLPSVQAWGRLEARASLFSDWLAGMDADAMATPRKVGSSAPLELWLAAERAAARARAALGLDPASYAKIARDLGIANKAGEDAVAALGAKGREIREKREAELKVIPGGSDDRSA